MSEFGFFDPNNNQLVKACYAVHSNNAQIMAREAYLVSFSFAFFLPCLLPLPLQAIHVKDALEPGFKNHQGWIFVQVLHHTVTLWGTRPGFKNPRGDYLSSEKSKFLHYLITLSGAWLTDICSQASHDKPLSITGATTRCCRRGYRRCLCWRDVEASPSHIAKETLQIEIMESKAEAAVTPKR